MHAECVAPLLPEVKQDGQLHIASLKVLGSVACQGPGDRHPTPTTGAPVELVTSSHPAVETARHRGVSLGPVRSHRVHCARSKNQFWPHASPARTLWGERTGGRRVRGCRPGEAAQVLETGTGLGASRVRVRVRVRREEEVCKAFLGEGRQEPDLEGVSRMTRPDEGCKQSAKCIE